MQRVLDIALSGLSILVLAPLLVPIVIVLRFTGEGEVLFVQQRVGRNGRPLGLYKFATMLKDSPHMGTGTVTLKDDPRVLPFGRFLRRTKLNELPQLLNVFLGDMSIIGPRPQTRRCFDAFPESSQLAIMRVRPGLSGVGSIVFRNEEELMDASGRPEWMYDELIMPYKGELEEWYVRHQGLWTYFACVVATLWVVVAPRSAIVWRLFPDLPRPPQPLIEAGLHFEPGTPAMYRGTRYREVAELHVRWIDQGFLSTLGVRFLELLYEAIDDGPRSVLLTEERNGRIVGFIAGSEGMAGIYRQLLGRPLRLAGSMLPALGSVSNLRKILEIFLYSRRASFPAGTPNSELLSLVVHPQHRGSGVAERLYRRLAEHFALRSAGGFRIVVGDALAPAHRFYRRMGAEPAGRIHVHGGQPSTVYVHRLQSGAPLGAIREPRTT